MLNIGMLAPGQAGHGATFTLPDSFVTDTTAILAKKRTGKSNTGVVIAEEVFKAGQQVSWPSTRRATGGGCDPCPTAPPGCPS